MHVKRRKEAPTKGDRQPVEAKTGCCQMEKGTLISGY